MALNECQLSQSAKKIDRLTAMKEFAKGKRVKVQRAMISVLLPKEPSAAHNTLENR